MPSPQNISQLILQKRNGGALSEQQITQLVQGYTRGQIPDYQLSALAMAIYFQGFNHDETVALTRAKVASGNTLVWNADDRPVIDKHSTGGIGDKTSLVLVPLLACFDVCVPKLSGRGLGTTGGTLDKLESIPGFRVDYTTEELQKLVRSVGCAIVSANQDLAPADKKLYALRDVTGTVDVIPLITASILSKKMAEGLDALILDVKCGHGALMHTLDEARQLALSLVDVARDFKPRCVAVISDMNMPLGSMVGNACEVLEAIDVLRANHAGPLRDLVLELGSELLVSASLYENKVSAMRALQQKLDSGYAFEKFGEMVRAQQGSWPCEIPLAPKHPVQAVEGGWVRSIDGRKLGQLVVDLGGGRKNTEDSIDHGVGIEILIRPGERFEPGQTWANIFSRRELCPKELDEIQTSLCLVNSKPSISPIILDRIQA
jgi:pyrimidine-nucleoside phosphorylase